MEIIENHASVPCTPLYCAPSSDTASSLPAAATSFFGAHGSDYTC